MIELTNFKICIERTVTIIEVAEVEIEAVDLKTAITNIKDKYHQGLLKADFDEANREVDDVYFLEG